MTARTQNVLIGLVLALALTILYAIAWSNYKECQSQGFSRLYCTTTHLIGR